MVRLILSKFFWTWSSFYLWMCHHQTHHYHLPTSSSSQPFHKEQSSSHPFVQQTRTPPQASKCKGTWQNDNYDILGPKIKSNTNNGKILTNFLYQRITWLYLGVLSKTLKDSNWTLLQPDPKLKTGKKGVREGFREDRQGHYKNSCKTSKNKWEQRVKTARKIGRKEYGIHPSQLRKKFKSQLYPTRNKSDFTSSKNIVKH